MNVQILQSFLLDFLLQLLNIFRSVLKFVYVKKLYIVFNISINPYSANTQKTPLIINSVIIYITHYELLYDSSSGSDTFTSNSTILFS